MTEYLLIATAFVYCCARQFQAKKYQFNIFEENVMSQKALKFFRCCLISASLVSLVDVSTSAQDRSWLNQPVANWNKPGRTIPKAAKGEYEPAVDPRCKETLRAPETAADRQLIAAGWKLFGPIQSYSGTSLIKAMSGVDGMCRPMGFHSFVFVGGKFAGTLTPDPMSSRADGVESHVWLTNASSLFAEFSRYKDSDPLCCPSGKAGVQYQIKRTAQGPVLVPNNPENTGGETQENKPEKAMVTGTVFYRERSALPPNAVVQVQLADVSRADAAAVVLGEQTIELKGKQVPIPFEINYDPQKIDPRFTYAVSARITVDGKLWFISTTRYSVITNNQPVKVDILVQRVK